jgi:hypothetical protein
MGAAGGGPCQGRTPCRVRWPRDSRFALPGQARRISL